MIQLAMSGFIYKYQKEINQICGEYGISYLAIFGSQARNEARDDSDVDFLVEFKNTPGLIEFIKAKQEFEKVLNKKVDMVTKNSLSKYLAPYVNRDIQRIYG